MRPGNASLAFFWKLVNVIHNINSLKEKTRNCIN